MSQASSQPYASASLYVGDLSPDATEGQLFDVFRNVGGPVASIRVCRDTITKRSLGYAYVNFHNVADAERAMEQLNFTPILGKPCRIMWSQRDPAKRKSGTGNVFIKNLDKSINNAALYDTFSVFGHILSCKVELDQNGASKGYGYVHYETQEEADQAIAKVNGMQMAEKIVFVGPFQPRKARSGDAHTLFTNVYVNNLDASVTKEQIEELFVVHGTINSCAVVLNDKGESKGFGYVNFDKPESAQAAIEQLNGTTLNGKQLFVGRFQKRQERDEELRHQRLEQLQKYQGANVYLKNLDDNVTDEKLQQEFSRFGSIASAKVMTDEKGNSKGFGFVWFSNPEDATRAINEMNGVIFGTKPLYASLAQRKEVRRAQLATLHQQKINMMQMNLGMYPAGPQVYYPPMGIPRIAQPYPPQMVPRGPARFQPQQQPNPQAINPQQQQQQQPPQQQQPGPYQQGPRGPQQGFQQGAVNGPGAAGQPGGFQNGASVGQRQGNRPRNPRPPPIAQQQQPQQLSGGGRGRGQNAQGQVNRTYKYTSTARNQPGFGYPQVPPEIESDPEAAKQMVGEQLYAVIVKSQPALAGKITGMLIESHDVRDLFDIARNPALLESKISEALAVLQAHGGGEFQAHPDQVAV